MAVVVLGKRLMPNGAPSSMLVNRMKHASNVYAEIAERNNTVMIVTGKIIKRRG